MNPGRGLESHFSPDEFIDNPHTVNQVNTDDIEKYFAIREISGVSSDWLKKVKRWIKEYLEYIHYKIDDKKTLSYIKHLKDTHSITFYRKKAYQIRHFLEYLKYDWASDIRLPSEPVLKPVRISMDDIQNTLDYFRGHSYELQFRALIHLGMDSGMRAEELYQLRPSDIDLDNRIISINHDPNNGQTTKNKISRISYFDTRTKDILIDYFNNGNNSLKKLFNQTHIERAFSKAPIRVKHLRKFFSQEWDRRGGPTSIKEILMGHSINKDVDLMHYNFQSEEDLKQIYDKVMNTNVIER